MVYSECLKQRILFYRQLGKSYGESFAPWLKKVTQQPIKGGKGGICERDGDNFTSARQW